MRLCPICNKRPAKRSCPALASSICSICCALDRMINLECPESCSYLKSGRAAALEKVFDERARYIDDHGVPFDNEIPGFGEIMTTIESMIIAVLREKFKSLTDQDVAEGIDNVVRTMETQRSGIIYSHQANTAAAQAVSDSVMEVIDLLKERVRSDYGPSASQLMTIVRAIRQAIAFHMSRSTDGRDYLRFTTQFYPYPEKKESLIIAP